MRVIYPGSFDPPTRGHVDLMRRAARLFDEVIVLVIGNPQKQATLDVRARVALIQKCVGDLPNIRVEAGERLLADAVRRLGADAILRGLRGSADYVTEQPVADAFLDIFTMETVFLQCAPALTYVSSTMARQLIRLGGRCDELVPDAIAEDVKAAYR